MQNNCDLCGSSFCQNYSCENDDDFYIDTVQYKPCTICHKNLVCCTDGYDTCNICLLEM
jgi:hypothetical protein